MGGRGVQTFSILIFGRTLTIDLTLLKWTEQKLKCTWFDDPYSIFDKTLPISVGHLVVLQ